MCEPKNFSFFTYVLSLKRTPGKVILNLAVMVGGLGSFFFFSGTRSEFVSTFSLTFILILSVKY